MGTQHTEKQDKADEPELVYIKEPVLSRDTLLALSELGEILRQIDKRLVSEGYTIIDGQIKKIDVIEF